MLAQPVRLQAIRALLVVLSGTVPLVAADAEPGPITTSAVSIRRSSGWFVAETANFTCRNMESETTARDLAITCERLREHLRTLWGTPETGAEWTPRCEVVVHPSQTAYNQALSRLNDVSVGSTRLNFDQGRITVRRIDLRSDAKEWRDGALPHELTHVVIAEHFHGRALPRWADEGIAMLSESRAKHHLRLTDLRRTLQTRPTYHMHELARLTTMPAADRRDAFYGQSLALTSRLVQRSSPAEFLAFLKSSEQYGIDQALRSHFQMDGLAGLQADWEQWVHQPERLTIVDLRFASVLLAADVE